MNIVALAATLALLSPFANAKIITSAVGRVKDHIVTSREVQINQALDQALSVSDPKKIKITKDQDSKNFAKQVTSVLLEWVVHYEAKNMSVANVTGGEVAAAISQATTKLSKLEEWRNLKVTPKEVETMFERKLAAKKFIRFRADSSVVPVSDVEAERYYEQNRLKFGDLPFENFRSNIKNFLSRQQVEGRLKDWFEVLQAKYQVRNFLAEI